MTLALLVPAVAVSDDKPASTVVVDFTPEPGTRAWLASAFEQTVARELSGFERLTPVAKEDLRTRHCGPETECRLRGYRDAHVDIVLFGRVGDDAIAYELYQTWTPARLATGSIAIGRKQTPIGLKQETRAAFHPVLKHGGLLDQRPYMVATPATARPRWGVFEPELVLGALIVALIPFAWFALRTRSIRRVGALRTARRTAWGAGVVALVALAAAAYGSLAELVAAWPWVFAAAGGLAWGTIALLGVRGVFPPLDGLTRVAHHDVWRILRAWFALAALRFALLVALYAPVVALALWLADRLAMPVPWSVVLLVPATGFFARAWLHAWIECLAIRHDARFVDGPASPDQPRSRELAEYVIGYVRRTGWDVDPELLGRVVFLPGKVDGIVTYGGGPTHARIVIDRDLVALALGAAVEVQPDEKPAATFPDWTAGTIAARASRDDRIVPDYHARKPHAAVFRRPLGQAATLLGYVIPSPGQSVPLISDNPADLAVVRALLSEHYPWNAPDPDDEFDTTDPSDKDFLFGAIVRELGVIQRRDCELATLALAAGARLGRIALPASTRIADTFTVLNFARHHYLQYLHYRHTASTELLTSRADSHRLLETSTKVIAATRTAKPNRSRRRLAWLSWFVGEPIVDARETRARRLVLATAIAAALVVAGAAVMRAIDYHPIYVDRMQQQERMQQEGSAHGEVKENQ